MDHEQEQTSIEAVLDELYAQRGLSFHMYRRSTIERRLAQRLAAVRAADFGEYVRLLYGDPGEVDRLVAHLTLKVTGFFRNPQVFALLRKDVLPALVERQRELSVWSAGCATGEEVYSLAMAFAELGSFSRRQGTSIIGTDVDNSALASARSGRYPLAAVSDLPAPALERWFTAEETNRGIYYIVRDDLRTNVQFAWHNLVDALGPPAESGAERFDLILCRNVLIYFERPLQERVVSLVFESLRPGGYLVLGEAESLPAAIEPRCQCIDRRSRVYRRLGEV